MLIRLDEKTQNGFANVLSRLDSIDRRQDGHDLEIQSIKLDLADREQYKQRFEECEDKVDGLTGDMRDIKTTVRNAKAFGIAVWAVFGLVVTTLLLKVFGLL